MPALLLSMLTHLLSSLSLSYFILAVPMRKCLGKHSCMSSSFPMVIPNTFFRQCNYKSTKENSVRDGDISPRTSNPLPTKLNSITTNRHGVAAFDFVTVSGCYQLVVRQRHARGSTLDLLLTDAPDLVQAAVVALASIGNSDHSSLSAVISMAQAVPNLCVSWKYFLKYQAN